MGRQPGQSCRGPSSSSFVAACSPIQYCPECIDQYERFIHNLYIFLYLVAYSTVTTASADISTTGRSSHSTVLASRISECLCLCVCVREQIIFVEFVFSRLFCCSCCWLLCFPGSALWLRPSRLSPSLTYRAIRRRDLFSLFGFFFG